jgi:hypothetical protein
MVVATMSLIYGSAEDKWTGSIDALKDQLVLAIGHFYSSPCFSDENFK